MAKPRHSYLIHTVTAGKTIEIYKTQSARYKCRDTHAPRSSATPEQMAKVNDRRARDKFRQVLNENFQDGDAHLTLKYSDDTRPSETMAAQEILIKFLRRAGRKLVKRGIELKYLYIPPAIGKRGRKLHHHIIVNAEAIPILRAMWKPLGQAIPSYLYTDGQYRELAEYLMNQEIAPDWSGRRYAGSRNLRQPKDDVKRVPGSIWRKEEKCPEGCYPDPEFPPEDGVCEVTGYAYRRRGFRRIEPAKIHEKEERQCPYHLRS